MKNTTPREINNLFKIFILSAWPEVILQPEYIRVKTKLALFLSLS
jgi:hypothetical protein